MNNQTQHFITWRQLKEVLDELPDEALDKEITVEKGHSHKQLYLVKRIIGFDAGPYITIEII